MKTFKKVFNKILNVIFGILLIGVIAGVALVLMGYRPYITMSGSMEPAIHTGSVCVVNTKATYEDIKENDIVAFRVSTGSLVTHRVIDVTERGFETKGDANDMSDGISTTRENFYGKTVFSVPGVGYVIKYLQQPWTIAIIIALIILVIWPDKKEKDEEKDINKSIVETEENEKLTADDVTEVTETEPEIL